MARAALSGPDTVGLSWTLLRLSILVDAWLAQPSVVTVDPTAQHLRVLRDLLLPLGTGGNLTADAHLAALAIEHGAELCSSDRDFDRFPRLRWRNPLI